jgi:hypothetical protein
VFLAGYLREDQDALAGCGTGAVDCRIRRGARERSTGQTRSS